MCSSDLWWVSRGIRAEREFCCDDAALARSSDGAVYARALATLEGWRSVQPAFGLSTLGGPLMVRIQRLLGIRPSIQPVRGPLTALGAVLALGCATAMAHDPAQGSDPERLAALRKQIEEMQEHLDELRASLDEAGGGRAPGETASGSPGRSSLSSATGMGSTSTTRPRSTTAWPTLSAPPMRSSATRQR